MRGPEDEPERGGGRVARDALICRQHGRASLDLDHRPAVAVRQGPDGHAPSPEHSLRVVAGRDSLAHPCGPARVQPGQEDRGLHLRRRHWGCPLDRPEGTATRHGHRWEGIVVESSERRAHRAQRFDDTGHRTPSQRRIAVQDGRDGHSGEDAGKQAEACPGVSAVEDPGRLVDRVDAR